MTKPGTAATFMMVERKVGDLRIDPNVQRQMKKHRVVRIASSFRPDALGVLTTSYRSADLIHVIDGQHRLRAAEMAGYDGPIQTMEYHHLSIPEEAALFRLLNDAEKPSSVDRFLVACVEQDPDACRLAGYLADNGWIVGPSSIKGRLSAIASLQRIYALSPEAAASTLAVVTKAYGHEPDAVQGSLLEGIGRMLARYGRDINLDQLADRLAKFPGGAPGLLGHARGQAVTRTGNLSTHVARVITNIYNQQRRSTRVADWA